MLIKIQLYIVVQQSFQDSDWFIIPKYCIKCVFPSDFIFFFYLFGIFLFSVLFILECKIFKYLHAFNMCIPEWVLVCI